jgi:uncharacterized protein with FMN-binding domain
VRKLVLSLAVVAASGAYVARQVSTEEGGATALLGRLGLPVAASGDRQLAMSVSAEGEMPPLLLDPVTPQPAEVAQPAPPPAEVAALPPLPEPVAPVLPSPPPAAEPAPPAATFERGDRGVGGGRGRIPGFDGPTFTPPRPQLAPALPPVAALPQPAPTPTPAPFPEPQSQALAAVGKYHDGTYTGSRADAYFGMVQVRAHVEGGRLVSVEVLDYPADRRTSRRINDYALPVMETEVVAAQSANVNIISGATLTVLAYMRSLRGAPPGGMIPCARRA